MYVKTASAVPSQWREERIFGKSLAAKEGATEKFPLDFLGLRFYFARAFIIRSNTQTHRAQESGMMRKKFQGDCAFAQHQGA